MPSPRHFLVSPLDWGLGHATRCVPVIRRLLEKNQRVSIAASGAPASLLAQEFPGLPIVPIVNYHMRYTRHPALLPLAFPFMIARVYNSAKKEHARLDTIIQEHAVDCVIADQRFGCHSHRARSIYISHQLCVKMPRPFATIERIIWLRLRRAAESFNELWIPDWPGPESLTGDLTHKYPLPPHARFVGPLSRFAPCGPAPRDRPGLLVVLSGPEPQRTAFERAVLTALCSFDGSAVVVRGTPGQNTPCHAPANVTLLPHASTDRLQQLFCGAAAVVCRGGYTTIMDLVTMKKKAVIVPTPGQTEQEYLCRRAAQSGRFVMRTQKDLDIPDALRELDSLQNRANRELANALDRALEDTLAVLQ
ncbi:MAG: hypothetical protein GF418_15830 [Chitinivibrionales bacterium]|nr:hypothetical protein [Chitinivibrionales bacterium]